MKDLIYKIVQFYCEEYFAEYGDDVRLELTAAELSQISNLLIENERLKTKLSFIEKESTLYYPKFRNQQEKHRVIHTVTAIEKFFNIIGNDDAINDISVLKELVCKMDIME